MDSEASVISVLIADDHVMFRQGLAAMIRARAMLQLIGEAGNGREAWELVVRLRPDVAVLDLSMPEMKGTEVVKRSVEEGLSTRFLILTMHSHDTLVEEAMRVGATGCLVKEDAFEDLESAIRQISAGEFFVSRSLKTGGAAAGSVLSPREREIARGIIDGLTNKELATRFRSSVKTIETHRVRLMRKMGARNTADIVRLGLERGL